MSGRVVKIGTRGSALALEQAHRVQRGITGPSEICIIRTSGDRFREQPLGESSQIGFFTKEIEDELYAGRIDLAVHSLKDLPTTLAEGLELGAVLRRDDPADILLVRPEALDPGNDEPKHHLPVMREAKVGASSLRRQALLKRFNPDLQPVAIRGNVPTRIEKAASGEYDSIILSRAGLERLKLDVAPLAAFELNPRTWTCAPGQATIAVEVRRGDDEIRNRLSALHDSGTYERVQAERSLLAAYGGGCHVPFGAFADRIENGFELFVAAPVHEEFIVRRFEAGDLETARRAAEAWIRADRTISLDTESGASTRQEADEWLSRPARAWF
jgi:hydroxymethylbilane synthase